MVDNGLVDYLVGKDINVSNAINAITASLQSRMSQLLATLGQRQSLVTRISHQDTTHVIDGQRWLHFVHEDVPPKLDVLQLLGNRLNTFRLSHLTGGCAVPIEPRLEGTQEVDYFDVFTEPDPK